VNDAFLLPRRVERADAKPWPFRPKPLDDELLSSFIARLAAGLGMKPITFLNSIMGSRKNLLAQDLDNFAPANLVKSLATGCAVNEDALTRCTLASFEGAINHNHNKRGRNPWILPTTIDNNARLRPGLQFCPLCLADDKPHFRKTSRLAFVTACTRHGVRLRDRCPHCSEPIRPLEAASPWLCSRCDGDVRVATEAVAHRTLVWQQKAEAAANTGCVQLGWDFVPSATWFAIARQIAALMVNGPRCANFRSATAKLYGGDDSPYPKPTKRQPFEYLEVADRLRLFDQVAKLMEGWPHRFVQAAWDAGIRRSHAIKDMAFVPFIYEFELRAYLDATPYYASDGEVAAAAAWLRRTKGAAYYRDLKELCGESRKAIYRHMDYQRKQSKPSIWLERSRD
tara:strand:+ start:4982 stop:6172 length:1191 start_codon:yes stop_codon:yes gene_type:complete